MLIFVPAEYASNLGGGWVERVKRLKFLAASAKSQTTSRSACTSSRHLPEGRIANQENIKDDATGPGRKKKVRKEDCYCGLEREVRERKTTDQISTGLP